MADVFEDKLNGSYESLKNACGDKVEVTPERKFIGFDGYKKALDCLKPGDIAILRRRSRSAGCILPTRLKNA